MAEHSGRGFQHHTRKGWAIMVYIAVVVTVTLLMLGYQYARYGHL